MVLSLFGDERGGIEVILEADGLEMGHKRLLG